MIFSPTKPAQQAAPITLPVLILSGLLGSGKTTLLRQLIQTKQQEAPTETWHILLNDFGELNLDAPRLATSGVIITPLAGGCICCTAEHLFVQQLQQLTKQTNPDRLIIEPSGLANPTAIIRAIRRFNQQQLHTTFKIIQVITLVDATQFSESYYQRSDLLRDMLSLADHIILTKADLLATEQAKQQQAWLQQQLSANKPVHLGWPDSSDNKSGRSWNPWQPARKAPSFHLLNEPNSPQLGTTSEPVNSIIPGIISAQLKAGDISLLSWHGQPEQLWSRSALKTMMAQPPAGLLRLKGILRTGKDWQAVQWSPSGVEFSDQAWYLDNRLEILVDWPYENFELMRTAFEQKLSKCVQVRDLI
ncbi:cobalamin synthesis protein P47K [Thiomicrospira cyclica ALM1]|uniref:Cobalamin synthesis protein P47K n=2 Tax=Thiomicrospira cyclica TaxID=147268 RepID=F6DAE9_THICA|nr:cobalamin synthesis protein P47K [Thiomicrospira cyclica ALM1]